ncbi:MAG TPA: alanine racemase, partial [Phycisphaerae bacterium]|nr:alanine racemase [Phycisphaerae bacterium]
MIPQFGTLEISRSRLRHNLALLQQNAGRAKLCATIKANAYGHGIQPLSQLMEAEGIEWACVYNLQEAIDLASRFHTLVLAPLQSLESHDTEIFGRIASMRDIVRRLDDRNGQPIIRINITTIDSARELSKLAAESKIQGGIRIHMQIDAGLNRAGIEPREAPALADIIGSLPHLALEGVFAHFSHGDEPGHPTLHQQTTTLLRAADEIKVKFPNLLVHIQNSGGTFHVDRQNAFDL